MTFVVDFEKQTLSQNAISNCISGIFVLYERELFLLFSFLLAGSVKWYQRI